MGSASSDVAAVIMAGGKGSRIGTLGDGKPKCLLPVGRETLLTRLISQLREAGVTKILVCCSPENVGCIGTFLATTPLGEERDVKVVACSACQFGPLPALEEILANVSADRVWMCLADIYFAQSPFKTASEVHEWVDADCGLVLGTDESLREGRGSGFVSRDGGKVRAISYAAPIAKHWINENLRWSGAFFFRSQLSGHLRENLTSYSGAPFESWIQGLLASEFSCVWKDAGGFVNVNAVDDYQYLVSRYGDRSQ
jgi:NDP-sugar pyrophosphorylase family protein